MLSPSPLEQPHKPGYAMHPMLGVEPLLLDSTGKEITGNDVNGLLAIRRPTPGMARTILGDHERFMKTYWDPVTGFYITGDGARRDPDGHYRVTGRVDDVINISGHRLGTEEVSRKAAIVPRRLIKHA